mmetsp:Transcript_14641/g.46043  ORF Transcript_14641/g.46043 Transcript_14641/m.46043 type:complete len:284 (+) Transcript_14641:902-1753(+)
MTSVSAIFSLTYPDHSAPESGSPTSSRSKSSELLGALPAASSASRAATSSSSSAGARFGSTTAGASSSSSSSSSHCNFATGPSSSSSSTSLSSTSSSSSSSASSPATSSSSSPGSSSSSSSSSLASMASTRASTSSSSSSSSSETWSATYEGLRPSEMRLLEDLASGGGSSIFNTSALTLSPLANLAATSSTKVSSASSEMCARPDSKPRGASSSLTKTPYVSTLVTVPATTEPALTGTFGFASLAIADGLSERSTRDFASTCESTTGATRRPGKNSATTSAT